MKFEKIEIDALRELLSLNQNQNNPVLKNILNKINSTSLDYTMFIDGAADLHSKTSGIGGVIYKNNDELFTFSEYLDDATNNEAEYTALIHGLKSLLKLSILNITIFSDSELVVKQINGEYKVKNDRMKKLHFDAHTLLSKFEIWKLVHVLRDKNIVADKLATNGRLKIN
jgi:ribonuclease HI|tara:strand:- start:470 stop:979 length:510 start_codon:yes stop_codon:yes gene_type:complete